MYRYNDPTFLKSISVFTVSLILFLSELTLFRLLHYKFDFYDASLVISYALLGISIGALISSKVRISEYSLFFFVLVTQIFFLTFFGYFFLVISTPNVILRSISALIFIPCGTYISYIFTKYNPRKVYFWDLLGAGFAVFLFTYLIENFLIEQVFVLVISFTAIILFLLSLSRLKIKSIAISLTLVTFSYCLFYNISLDHNNLFNILINNKQNQNWKEFGKDRNLVKSFENSISRIDLYQGKNSKKRDRYIYADNGIGQESFFPSYPKRFRRDPRILFDLVKEPKVFVIGASAQGIVKTARYHTRPENITAVEINPVLIEIMQNNQFGSKAYYPQAGLDVKKGNALYYLKKIPQKYDVITNMNGHSMGHMFLEGPPDYLHTMESYQIYFNKLTERGFFMLEQRPLTKSSKKIIQKRVATIYEALHRLGIKQPQNHLFIYSWHWDTKKKFKKFTNRSFTSILIKKNPINEDDIEIFFDLLRINPKNWYDKNAIKFKESSNNNLKESHILYEHLPGVHTSVEFKNIFKTLEQKSHERPLHLKPVTNDQPFSFFADNSFYYKLKSLIPLFLINITLLFFLLYSCTKTFSRHSVSKHLLYQFLCGFSYIALEVWILNFYLGEFQSPGISFAIVLFTLLVSSAIGGFHLSRYINLNYGFVLIILSISAHFIVRDHLLFYFNFPLLIKYSAILIPIIFSGVVMGVFFPYAQSKLLYSNASFFRASSFATNCLGGTIATGLTYILLVTQGFLLTSIIILFMYLFAIFLFSSFGE